MRYIDQVIMTVMDVIHYHVVNIPSTHHYFTQKREIKLRREYKNILNITKYNLFHTQDR